MIFIRRSLFSAGVCAVLILLAGCGGMEEKKDYLVSVKAPFTEDEFEALDIAADDIKHEYSIMDMYLISLNENQVAELESHENVKYVEEDKEVSTPEEGGVEE